MRKQIIFITVFLISLLLFGIIFYSNRKHNLPDTGSIQVSPTKTTYYDYSHFNSPENSVLDFKHGLYILNAKNKLELIWKAFPTVSPMLSRPLQVTLSAELLGPFSSFTKLQTAIYQSGSIKEPVVGDIKPVHTTNLVDQKYSETMEFSSALRPGYYLLIQIITLQGPQGTLTGQSRLALKIPS